MDKSNCKKLVNNAKGIFLLLLLLCVCVCVCVCVYVCVLSAGFPVWYTVRDNCRLYMILFLSWEHFHFIWIVA